MEEWFTRIRKLELESFNEFTAPACGHPSLKKEGTWTPLAFVS
jgi:hypothetical protein